MRPGAWPMGQIMPKLRIEAPWAWGVRSKRTTRWPRLAAARGVGQSDDASADYGDICFDVGHIAILPQFTS